MTYKLIKIGSSTGVIIPKKQLDEKSVTVGDEINFDFEPTKKPKHTKLMQEYDEFVAQYGETLKNLSDR